MKILAFPPPVLKFSITLSDTLRKWAHTYIKSVENRVLSVISPHSYLFHNFACKRESYSISCGLNTMNYDSDLWSRIKNFRKSYIGSLKFVRILNEFRQSPPWPIFHSLLE